MLMILIAIVLVATLAVPATVVVRMVESESLNSNPDDLEIATEVQDGDWGQMTNQVTSLGFSGFFFAYSDGSLFQVPHLGRLGVSIPRRFRC